MVDDLLLLWLAALPLMGSPGPATLSLAALGSAYGVSASLKYLAGIIAGTTTVLLVVASGVSGVIRAAPGMLPVVAAVAAVYIAYLAWRIATAAPPAKRAERRRAPSFVGGYGPRGRQPQGLRRDRGGVLGRHRVRARSRS